MGRRHPWRMEREHRTPFPAGSHNGGCIYSVDPFLLSRRGGKTLIISTSKFGGFQLRSDRFLQTVSAILIYRVGKWMWNTLCSPRGFARIGITCIRHFTNLPRFKSFSRLNLRVGTCLVSCVPNFPLVLEVASSGNRLRYEGRCSDCDIHGSVDKFCR